MPFTSVETCCKCGRPIDLKKVKTFRVGEDFRLVCEECLADRPSRPPERDRKKQEEKKR